jgi:2,4-dienoyl-CoA reductase-like NADH-dependent reductase (Old Yellow Enzyme family)
MVRRGFGPDESKTLAKWLDEAGLDLIELSGGTYECVPVAFLARS